MRIINRTIYADQLNSILHLYHFFYCGIQTDVCSFRNSLILFGFFLLWHCIFSCRKIVCIYDCGIHTHVCIEKDEKDQPGGSPSFFFLLLSLVTCSVLAKSAINKIMRSMYVLPLKAARCYKQGQMFFLSVNICISQLMDN